MPAKEEEDNCLVCCYCYVTFIVGIIMSIIIVILYYGANGDKYPSTTLGDTRLVGFNSELCSGGQMTISSPGYDGGMYFLDEEPRLSAWSTLWLNETFAFVLSDIEEYNFYDYGDDAIVYVTWEFHLNEGSIITDQSCIETSNRGGVNFLVIQGNRSYKHWIKNSSLITAYKAILAYCGSGQTLVSNFLADSGADYYIVYYVTSGDPQIHLGLTIYRTEYSTVNIPEMHNCSCNLSRSSGSCSAQSQSSSNYVLLQTMLWSNNASIKQAPSFTLEWECFSRNSVYAAIFLVPFFCWWVPFAYCCFCYIHCCM